MVYEYKVRIDRVIDGDTIDVWCDMGFNLWKLVRVRLDGINTPEVRGDEREMGLESKAFVISELRADWPEEERPGVYILESRGLDKYGRSLGVIWYGSDDDRKNICEELLAHGLAKPYHGSGSKGY